jgi:membrane protease YdiL (CAAX protease family)
VFAVAPLGLMLATLVVFRAAQAVGGDRAALFAGFGFYWLLGGVVLPLLLIGRDGYAAVFARRKVRWSVALVTAVLLLIASVAFALLFAFPALFPVESNAVLVGLAAYALVNGTLEEVFWRGVFLRRFPASLTFGVIYPAILFGTWQLVPWSVFPNWPVPADMVLMVTVPLGLLYNWVAWHTGSIRWTVLAHVLTNMSGLGAMVLFGPIR